ncbi:MAG: hypothetical protein IPK50_03220 [Fibrobacterota bacterium]|nr:hypothetical protein [Fibrobacterota bacterium]QQS05907.1 MAG: hypothetical protein IPK50_03220 [Fibrobacterota bacterium]
MRHLPTISAILALGLVSCDRGVAPEGFDPSYGKYGTTQNSPQSLPGTLIQGDNASLQSAVASIQADLSAMRNLPFNAPVVSSWVTRPRLMILLDSIEASNSSPPDTGSGPRPTETEIYVALNLMAPAGSMESDRRAFDSANIDGFYVPGTGKFWMVEDSRRSDSITYSLMAHELAHAMQDLNFADTLGQDAGMDERLAFTHVIEGEAQYLGDLWSLQDRTPSGFEEGFERYTLADAMAQASMGHSKSPLVLTLPLFSYYWVGEWSIHDQRKHAGWGAIDALHRTPPRTTKRMLHPLAGSAAQTFVEWSEEGFSPRQNLIPLGSDRLGEIYLATMLYWQLPTQSWKAASWKGDRFWVWRAGDSTHHIVAARLKFEAGADASQFLTDWAKGRGLNIKNIGDQSNIDQTTASLGLVRAERRFDEISLLFGKHLGGWPAGLADAMWSELAAIGPINVSSARRSTVQTDASKSDFPRFPSKPIRIWKEYSSSRR